MARYAVGQPVTFSTTVKVRNINGTYSFADPTTIVLTIQVPDGSTLVYSSPTHDGTGLYHQDLPATDLIVTGHYQLKWVTTGTGAGVSIGSFDIFDPFTFSVLELDDAKQHLNIDVSDTTQDAEIQNMVDTITEQIEQLTGGPIVNRTIVNERVESLGYGNMICLRYRPLVSVTSIQDLASNMVLDLSGGLDLDSNASIVRKRLQLPFLGWGPFYSVTYVAGWGNAVPASINLAARIILAFLWETQRGPFAQPMMGGGDGEVTVPGMMYAIPTRAAELLSPFMRGPYA